MQTEKPNQDSSSSLSEIELSHNDTSGHLYDIKQIIAEDNGMLLALNQHEDGSSEVNGPIFGQKRWLSNTPPLAILHHILPTRPIAQLVNEFLSMVSRKAKFVPIILADGL